ncbi:MAG: arylsulfatase [Planctomycetota bacterium]|jgi:arylsulfatase A-like enzyme|nr:arylsulfatase [Planctomycetota bacterium]
MNDRPNIILVVADDIGFCNLGCYGSHTVKTPVLDRMASEGLRFTNAYCGGAVCAPSRAVLMTGNHQGHASVRGNPGGLALLEEDVTVASLLKQADYTCGGFGKWGLGDVRTAGVPEQHGFDEFFGYYHQIHAHTYYPEFLWRNSVRIQIEGNHDEMPPERGQQYSHDLIFEESVRFIRKNSNRPFFAYLPWTLPHGPLVIPPDEALYAQYQNQPWPEEDKLCATMISMFDRDVGRLLKVVTELAIEENTLLLVTSDHGASCRHDEGIQSCGNLRGQKGTLYEGGIRTPLIARMPGTLTAGETPAHLCYSADVLPTLCELAGIDPPPDTDGLSLVPTFLGETTEQPQATHEYLYWEEHPYNFGRGCYRPDAMLQALRRGNWKLVRPDQQSPPQLFNIASDPGEQYDLAGREPYVLDQLLSLLEQARTEPPPQDEPMQEEGQRYRR